MNRCPTENEDLTMKMGAAAGIEIPIHGMVYSKEGSLTYFIKRFDRFGRGNKLAVEDFAQLAGKSRDTKYEYSMEKIVTLLDIFCTFPLLEIRKQILK
ncbi:MAG: HipA domain-containing protein [Melioribacteraceae bacterium]|nr:HipA domain-containing protein [Melioribacteraceae bacterium]